MPDSYQPATTEANIVPRATVRDMVRRRQRAIDLFGQAYLSLAAAEGALKEASGAFHAIDLRGREDRYLHATKEEERHFLSKLDLPSQVDFTNAARKVIDRRLWSVVIELTELEKLMDKQAKDELQKALMEEVPEATEDNIFATLQQFLLDADTIFKRGIANCFSSLDRRFRSHDGWKIGSRVILSTAFDEWGSWNYHRNHRDTLTDIERTFMVLDGATGVIDGGIVHQVGLSRRNGGLRRRQSECESTYFKVRAFQNGNAHVWFKRDDLVEKVNKLLGEYYGAVIPEEREPDKDKGQAKTTLAKRYGFFPTPDAAVERLFEGVPLYREKGQPRPLVLEPSAGTGNLARRAVEKGAVVDCIEVQGKLADDLKQTGKYRKVLNADFLAVQPEPVYDVVIMNPPFDRERDIDHVLHALKFLKPDGCLTAIMSAGTEFRETRKAEAFRELMTTMGATWRDLPAGSFASVGTYMNTIMLRVYKDGRHRYGW
jgi:hypothetical protein